MTGIYDATKDQRRILFGPSCVRELPAEMRRLGGRAFLVTNKSIYQKSSVRVRLEELIGDHLVGVYAESLQHAPMRQILEATAAARALEPHVVITLGSGGAADIGKAVRLALWLGLKDEAGFLSAYETFRRDATLTGSRVVLPQVCLPTTLSGADFTDSIGVTTDESNRGKLRFTIGPLLPSLIILDAELSLDTPDWLWISTGVKVLDHAIARLAAPDAHPVVVAAARQALTILAKDLTCSHERPGDVQARQRLLTATWLSLFVVREASPVMRMGLSHALGRQIGGVTHASHGMIAAVVLPWALEFNAPVSGEGMSIAAEAFGLGVGLSGETAALALAGAIRLLVSTLGLPGRLRDIGVSHGDLPKIAERTMRDVSTPANPRPVTDSQEVLALLEKAF
jgi:maleylacetate reductase